MPAGGLVTAGVLVAGVVGGMMSNSSAKKGRQAAAAAAAAAYAELNKIGMPPDLSKEIIMKQFESMGELTPELEQEINMQASEVAKIQEDPALRNAQMEALNTLGGVSRGGLRAEDRAAYNQLRNQVQQDGEAKRQQILQQMQARGMGGSGANLAAQLQSAQASVDTASAGADTLAADASKRALEALSQRANLAGNVRGQDMSAAEMRASAVDNRNQFLYENSVARQRNNIAAQNAAAASNLTNNQRLAEMNTQQQNAELLRQQEAKRQAYLDALDLAKAKANALNNQGQIAAANGAATGAAQAGIASAIGQGIATYGNNVGAQKTTTGTAGDKYYMNTVK